MSDRSPAIQANWRAYHAGEASTGAYEFPLWTDAHLTGTMRSGLGPYQVINTIAIPADPGELLPAAVARVEVHEETDPAALLRQRKTDSSTYHGGGLNDELAALASLVLGARVRAGTENRRFRIGDDPRGDPVSYISGSDPVLPPVRRRIVPRAARSKSLAELGVLGALLDISPKDATVLVKAARLYQDALWIADSEPELAWVLFVSAVEAAGSRWLNQQLEDKEKVRAWGPGPVLMEILRDCGEATSDAVAQHLAPYVGAGIAFRRFVLSFCPDPPTDRPEPWGRQSWSAPAMAKVLKQIYGYRSQALHGGTPFPAPMCEVPITVGGGQHPTEVPTGLASATRGGAWLKKDTPILLHTFEYVVRTALVNWLRSLVSLDPGGAVLDLGPDGSDWILVNRGSERAMRRFSTKKEALAYSVPYARQRAGPVRLVVRRGDDTVQEVRRYGA